MKDEEVREIYTHLLLAYPTVEVVRDKHDHIMIRILDVPSKKNPFKLVKQFSNAMKNVRQAIYPKISTVILCPPEKVHPGLNSLFEEAKQTYEAHS